MGGGGEDIDFLRRARTEKYHNKAASPETGPTRKRSAYPRSDMNLRQPVLCTVISACCFTKLSPM